MSEIANENVSNENVSNENVSNNNSEINKENINSEETVQIQKSEYDRLKAFDQKKEKFYTLEEVNALRAKDREKYERAYNKEVSLRFQGREDAMKKQQDETAKITRAQNNSIALTQEMNKLRSIFVDNGYGNLYQIFDENPEYLDTLKKCININDVKFELDESGKIVTGKVTSSSNVIEVGKILISLCKKSAEMAINKDLLNNSLNDIAKKEEKNHEDTVVFNEGIHKLANTPNSIVLKQAYENNVN